VNITGPKLERYLDANLGRLAARVFGGGQRGKKENLSSTSPNIRDGVDFARSFKASSRGQLLNLVAGKMKDSVQKVQLK